MTATAHGLVQAALLGLLIAGGMAVYGLLLALFGVTGWAEAMAAIRHGKASALARLRSAWQTTAPKRMAFAGS